jgi:hypothetical protein
MLSLSHPADAHAGAVQARDDNLGTGTRYSLGIRPDGYGCENNFLSVGGTRIRPELRWIFFFTRG